MPYLDLTLMGCNSSVAIMSSMLLSVYVLGEKFICKHDLTALVLISAGCTAIVLTANSDAVAYKPAEIIELLLAFKALGFYAVTVSVLLLNLYVTSRYLKQLRRFEADIFSAQIESNAKQKSLHQRLLVMLQEQSEETKMVRPQTDPLQTGQPQKNSLNTEVLISSSSHDAL